MSIFPCVLGQAMAVMQEKPLFSVITVCFNDRQNLEKTAQSVLSQLNVNLEWVIVDGASTDTTVDYLKALSTSNARLRWSSAPDKGIYDAFNKGVAQSRGDYLAFICAGDLFCGPDTLSKVAAFIKANAGNDIYYGDAIEVDQAGGWFLRKSRGHDKIWWNLFTHHQSIFYSKECFNGTKYDDTYRIGGDYALTAELLKKGASAIRIPFPTCRFLLGGTSQQNYWLGERENWICRRRLGIPVAVCAAIYAAHAVIRFGRTRTPAIYRALRYASGKRSPHLSHVSSLVPASDELVSETNLTSLPLYLERELDETVSPPPDDLRNEFTVDGVRINCFTLDDAVAKIMREKANGNAFSVCTLNMDHVVKLRFNDRFREAYSKARFVLADGFPIALAGRFSGSSVKRACGADLILPLCKKAVEQGHSIFLLGSTQQTLDDCAKKLALGFPGLRIAGSYAPGKNFDPFGAEADKIIDILKRERPDFCFIALGAPIQEIFAARCVDHVQGTGFLCIGAGLDFIAGAQHRAPQFFQQYGTEWLWRLTWNPSRLGRRYVMSGLYMPLVLSQAVVTRLRSRRSKLETA